MTSDGDSACIVWVGIRSYLDASGGWRLYDIFVHQCRDRRQLLLRVNDNYF